MIKNIISPLVSVIIPTYNRSHLISQSIDSILNQTYQVFEIIVVDDGSTDKTECVIYKYKDDRIKYFKLLKNCGASAARNVGINNSNGELIAFLDSDDYWIETKLEKQIIKLQTSPQDVAVVHCGIKYIDFTSGKEVSRWIIRDDVNTNIFKSFGAAPGTPTLLIKKKALLDVGLFDEAIPSHEETDLGIRLAKKYKFVLVDEFLVVARRNHNQVTNNQFAFIRGKEIIYKKHNDKLDKNLSYNLCNIIGGYYIITGDFKKAKVYIQHALHHKFYKIKTIISFLLLILFPSFNRYLYKKKYQFMHLSY